MGRTIYRSNDLYHLFDTQIPEETLINYLNTEKNLEKSYFDYLGTDGTLSVDLIWLDGDEIKYVIFFSTETFRYYYLHQ